MSFVSCFMSVPSGNIEKMLDPVASRTPNAIRSLPFSGDREAPLVAVAVAVAPGVEATVVGVALGVAFGVAANAVGVAFGVAVGVEATVVGVELVVAAGGLVVGLPPPAQAATIRPSARTTPGSERVVRNTGLHPSNEGSPRRKTLVCMPLDSMTSAGCTLDLNALGAQRSARAHSATSSRWTRLRS